MPRRKKPTTWPPKEYGLPTDEELAELEQGEAIDAPPEAMTNTSRPPVRRFVDPATGRVVAVGSPGFTKPPGGPKRGQRRSQPILKP